MNYLDEMQKYPHLEMTQEKQMEIIYKYRETNDVKYLGELVLKNLRYVYKISLNFKSCNIEFEELLLVGSQGLIKAVETYDELRGSNFIMYAGYIIKQQILDKLIKYKAVVYIPPRVLTQMKKMKTLYDKKFTITQIAKYFNCSPYKVNYLLNYKISSFDADIYDTPTSLYNFIEYSDPKYTKDIYPYIEQFIEELKPRDKIIIKMRFGLGYKRAYTLQEIGDKFNITKERVRQCENRSLYILRQKIENNKI